jgi:hypothetical protein
MQMFVQMKRCSTAWLSIFSCNHQFTVSVTNSGSRKGTTIILGNNLGTLELTFYSMYQHILLQLT